MRLGKNVAWSTLVAAAGAMVMLFAAQGAMAAGITGTKHDFSAKLWGSGSTALGQICVVCHAPHNNNNAAGSLLWNHTVTAATFTMYSSPTLTATGLAVGAGSVSKLCLSCHDGTVAVDSFGGTGTAGTVQSITGGAKVGPDLSNDHPIGFAYNAALATADGGLKTPASTSFVDAASKVPLFAANLECASCHNVHDNANAPFLRIANTGSALCITCHNK